MLQKQYLLFALTLGIVVVLISFLGPILPGGVDWYESFLPATKALVTGQSPYNHTTGSHLNATAPWGLFAFTPLLLFSPEHGRNIWFCISLIGFSIALYRLRSTFASMCLFLISPPVIHSLLNANIDWIPILGFTLRPSWGIFLVSLKPQMASVVIIVWVIKLWQQGGAIRVLKEFLPFFCAMLIAYLIYGPWFLNAIRITEYSQKWNASLWPLSIPIGILLSTKALRYQDMKSAYAASPCLSPYVLFHAWSGALSALANDTLYMFVTVVGLWILVAIRFFP